MQLHLLGGGASQGLVDALAPAFERDTGCRVVGTFGAVGAMRDRLLAGAPADLVVLTRELIANLERDGRVATGSAAAVGTVWTGVAVRRGTPPPAVGDPASLVRALRAADAIYFPDPERATAGIHFRKVLDRLALLPDLDARLRTFPNGATAMAAMAAGSDAAPIGCTQVTEILNTRGVSLAGLLPPELGLATVYTVGVTVGAVPVARDFAARLVAPAAASLKRRLGFDAA